MYKQVHVNIWLDMCIQVCVYILLPMYMSILCLCRFVVYTIRRYMYTVYVYIYNIYIYLIESLFRDLFKSLAKRPLKGLVQRSCQDTSYGDLAQRHCIGDLAKRSLT